MTEKNYNPEQMAKKTMPKQQQQAVQTPKVEHKNVASSKTEEKTAKPEEKIAVKEEKKVQERPKKTEVMVNANDLPISTKHSVAICRFVKGKRIPVAISELEQVVVIKKAVPMTGEIPHRKGKMMSGRFPQKAAKEFIILLKSLGANANYNSIDNPIVSGAKANIGMRPFGSHRVRRKRTHITLTAKSISARKAKK